MKICTLCPRMCAVDRKSGERGICGQTTEIKVARAALHFWEEPCISGKNPVFPGRWVPVRSFFPAVHCTVCSARMKILQMVQLVR